MSEKQVKKKSSASAKSVAISKLSKIESAHQAMMLSIGVTAFVVGITAALSIWFVKNIIFNSSVIEAKDEAIKTLSAEQDAILSVSKTVIDDLSEDERLNVVAKSKSSRCSAFDAASAKTNGTTIEVKSLDNLNLTRTCTGLRVISDALPTSRNEDATKSDLHQLMLWAGLEVESISTSDAGAISLANSQDLYYDKLSLQIEDAPSSEVEASIDILQRSIRSFDISNVSIEFSSSSDSGASLDFNASLMSYYTQNSDLESFATTDVVCFDKTNEKCPSGN